MPEAASQPRNILDDTPRSRASCYERREESIDISQTPTVSQKAMPPRLQPRSRAISSILRVRRTPSRPRVRPYATASPSAAIASVYPPVTHTQPLSPPIQLHQASQPPSYKPPGFRKTQLLRQYASLLHSSPLILLFQHNNLRSSEWVGIRRELNKALRKVDETQAAAAGKPYQPVADGVQLQIVQTGIFAAALRVVEFYRPAEQGQELAHTLSKAAHDAVVDKKTKHALAPILSGPLALLTFPSVTPQHLKAALSILSPSQPDFPAPTRKANPGYHDNTVQTGLQKLLLLGARVEGKVFDVDSTKWVGGIAGGLDGLRGQLVAMLQGVGAGITNTLESAAKNLYLTMESRRTMLEDEEKGLADKLADGAPKSE